MLKLLAGGLAAVVAGSRLSRLPAATAQQQTCDVGYSFCGHTDGSCELLLCTGPELVCCGNGQLCCSGDEGFGTCYDPGGVCLASGYSCLPDMPICNDGEFCCSAGLTCCDVECCLPNQMCRNGQCEKQAPPPPPVTR